MSTTVVLGAQWGDEGKGKVTDFFASNADMVVRFQGGNNAGHTIVVKDKTVKLSLTPSGVLYPNCIPVIASGCVVDIGFLIDELKMLEENKKIVSDKALLFAATQPKEYYLRIAENSEEYLKIWVKEPTWLQVEAAMASVMKVNSRTQEMDIDLNNLYH